MKSIIDRYTTSDAEYARIMGVVDKVLEKLRSQMTYDTEIKLGGSAAKGTIIKGDFDCDVFVMFDPKYDDSKLSDYLQESLEKHWEVERLHGSRDYFQSEIDGILFEFVPVRKISTPSDGVNVTDSSPLHVDWITSKIKKNPDLRNEIILSKLFCKANRVYGAESYIRGFSGHVIDILVVQYGSFEELLKASQNWKEGDVVDVEKHGSAGDLNESKISPLIVIDPIQSERNAAASLGKEMIERFRYAAKNYMENPGEDYFLKKPVTIDDILQSGEGYDTFVFTVKTLDNKPDVAGSKMIKILSHMLVHLKIHGFKVVDSGWEWNKTDDATIWINVEKVVLPEKQVREGPPETSENNFKSFMEKHKYAIVKDGRAYAEVDTPFRTSSELIKNMLEEEYVKEKAKSISLSIHE